MWRLALATALMLGGCSTDTVPFPEQHDMAARWEAQNVYPANYKGDLLAYLRTYLNSPEHVRGAAVAPPQLKTVGPGQRYIACVRYNARDSDGKYMGVKDGAAVYVSGRLDQFLDQPKMTREICKDAAYAPFPELEKLTR
jgi:hypothetical protein